MAIPQVGFNYQRTNQAEFELFPLESLFKRDIKHHDPQQPHRIRFFLLIHIEGGQGSHMVDFEEYPLSAGSVIFVQPDQVHSFRFSPGLKGQVLLFTQGFLDKLHHNMRLPSFTPTHLKHHHHPLTQLDPGNRARCRALIGEMATEMGLDQPDPLIVMYLFSSLTLILHRLRPEQRQERLSDEQRVKLARFMEILELHFGKIRDANWYAEQINTTYKTLNNLCKRATDLTAKQVIDSYTTIEIKRRLVIGQDSIQAMAYDLGFEDASNFIKYFKKQTALTPCQFRQQFSQAKL